MANVHTTFNGITYNDFQIPFELSYQVDVWGRVRRTVEADRDQAQARTADLATVNLSMHSQLALYYFQARLLDAEEQLLNSTVTQYEQALGLIISSLSLLLDGFTFHLPTKGSLAAHTELVTRQAPSSN
jgi:outer membrane protein TolC